MRQVARLVESERVLLPQTAEYALRAMAALAALPPGHAARAEDLSRTTQIPRAYISKIMRKLVVAQLVESQRGHGGGFVLARPARDIRFADVLAAVDIQWNTNACVFGWASCSEQRACPLHPTWSKLKEQLVGWADRSTLADVDGAALTRIGTGRSRRPRATP